MKVAISVGEHEKEKEDDRVYSSKIGSSLDDAFITSDDLGLPAAAHKVEDDVRVAYRICCFFKCAGNLIDRSDSYVSNQLVCHTVVTV